MKFSNYFTINEFKCKCGKCKMPNSVPPDGLIEVLEEIREHFNSPLRVKSGYRCPEHNKVVGGAPLSRHVVGDAVDFTIDGVKTIDVYNYVIETYGDRPFGIAKKIISDPYRGFIHLDLRGRKARWDYPGSL